MELIIPMFYMLALQIIFFVFFYFVHNYRNKWYPVKRTDADAMLE